MRTVHLIGMSVFEPDAGGGVPGFDPAAHGVPRKHLKTMTRAVQLGVAAVHDALQAVPGWADVAAPRRGLYVGGSPQSGDADDLAPALAALGDDTRLSAFAERAVPLIPPLWLVKGLSNNILGYASAQFDFQGDNGNWCDGPRSGSVALCNAILAISEGRVDLAVAGGADCLRGAEPLLGGPCAEGAAFFVLAAEGLGGPAVAIAEASLPEDPPACDEGHLGAAAAPIALARAFRAHGECTVGGVRLRGA
jgi:hypothetical protein